MSNNKQSSVEYYINNLIDILGDEICNKLTIEQTNRIHFLEKQAKAMHKEEIEEAWDNAAIDATYGNKFSSPTQYYNETFGVPIHVEQPIINQISINGEFIDPTKCSEKHHYCAKRTSGICDNPNGCIFDKYSTGTTFTPSKPWNPPQPTTNEYEHVVKPEKTQSIHESPILAESISERASILVKEFNSIFTGEKYSEALALFCIRKIAELQLELELKRLLNI